jgi:hypothetical protein
MFLAALEDVLRGDFAGQPGALSAILEAAQEQLTAWNDEGPVGRCPVCLAGLDHGADAAGQAGLIRLPCYHVLHTACFAQLWQAEWLRQKEENAAITITEAMVACPECRQVASWEAVPQIHPSLEHLLVSVSIEKVDGTMSDHRDGEKGEEFAGVDEEEIVTSIPSTRTQKKQGAAKSQPQQQSSSSGRVDLFEVIMPRGLRTRLKPKWDARDHEGPILRNGACGIVAEFVDGKDATYLRPEGMDYWLPLHGGRNNCKMVRIDQDMPRPQKAPGGWIHGDDSLAVTSPGSAKASSVEGKAPGKECKKKKSKNNNPVGGYVSADKILGA